MAGRSIIIYLPNEQQKDLRVASMPNWTGSIVTARESQLELLLARDEVSRPGCYVMMSGDRYEDDAVAYIGQTSDLKQRLRSTDHQNRGWERIAFVSTSETSFSVGHYLYLEAKMIADAKEAGSVTLENGNSGSPKQGNLGEAQSADADLFLHNLKTLLPILGFDIFYKRQNSAPYEAPAPGGEQEFRLYFNKEHIGTSIVIDGSVIVKAGSQVLLNRDLSHTQYNNLRERLFNAGTIEKISNDRGTFLSDYEFNSPSAASAVILGRSDNGRTSWRTKSDKSVSLADWQEQQAKRFTNEEVA